MHSTMEKASEAAKDAKHAAQEAKEYAYEQKAEFVAKMRSELAETNAKIDKLLDAQPVKAGGGAQADARARLQALRAQAAELNKELDKANDTTKSNWDDFNAGLKKSYSDLRVSFKQSRQWLSEKIAP